MGVGVLDRLEVIERYIVLLLGVVDRPLPSLLHLEKELFILSRVNRAVRRFIKFEKHYKGPYSDVVNELVRNPLHHVDAFKIEDDRIFLTQKGRELFNRLVEEGRGDERFRRLLATLKMIRELYDRLSKEELLTLIYLSYPEYRERSDISERLLAPDKRKETARKLLEKGLITEEKCREMVEESEFLF